MAPPRDAAAVEPPEPAPPTGGSRLVMLFVIGVVVVGVLGAAGWFLAPRLFGAKHETAHAAEPEAVEIKATISLGAVVVNVSGGKQYLRAAVSLGVAKEADVKVVEEHRPELLDLLIGVLATADVDTLTSEDGRDELKDTILERIHDDLRLTKVARVYFTEYVIQ